MAKRQVEILISARDQAGKVLQGVGTSLKGLGVAAAAATAALGTLGAAMAVAAVEAGKQQQANLKLANALKSIGQNTPEVREELRKFNSELQRATAVGDEELAEIEALLISLGRLEGEGLKRATIATLDFAAALGQQTQAAAINVAKAASGYTSVLTRYGIQLDENLSETEKFNQALGIMEKNFGGAAEVMGRSFLGELKNVKNSFGDLVQAIGSTIANSSEFSNVIGGIIDSLGEMEDLVKNNQEAITRLASVFGRVFVGTLIIVIQTVRTLVGQAAQVIAELPAALGLGGVIEGLKQFGDDVVGITDELESAFAQLFIDLENIGRKGKSAGESLEDALGVGVKDAIQETGDAIERIRFQLQEFHFVDTALADMFERVTVQTRTLIDLWSEGKEPLEEQITLAAEVGENLAGVAAFGADRFSSVLVEGAIQGQLAFGKFFKALLADIAKAIVRMLVLKAIATAIPGFGILTGIVGFGKGREGGEASTGQFGGLVQGPFPGGDTVRALLQPGEIVLPVSLKEDFSAISELGKAIRSGRFGDGGGAQIQMTNVFQGAFGEDQMVELAADISDLVERKGVRLVSSEILS